jgi:hypothetical protein
MKLYVNMCIKLGKQKDSKTNWNDTKIPKHIEKYKEIYFSIDILGSIRTFWNITTCKMFIIKKLWFGINLNNQCTDLLNL